MLLEGIYPLLREIDSSPMEDRPGEFKVTLDDPTTPPWVTAKRKAMVLGGSALKLAHEFDGERSCAQIARDLKASGVGLPNDDFVLAMAQMLERNGLVRLGHAPWSQPRREPPEELNSVNPLRHQCTGCGRSCQGHIIGPLEDEFLERVPAIRAELDPLYPDLAEQEVVIPLESNPDSKRLALRPNKICVFLGEDHLCRIHKHMGSAAKPLICRIFPVQTIQTEDGLRVGVSRCFDAHKSYKADTPEQTPAEITGVNEKERIVIDKRGLNPADRLNLQHASIPGTMATRNNALEQRVMILLEHPMTTVEVLLKFVLEVTTNKTLPSTPLGLMAFEPFARALSDHLSSFGAQAHENSRVEFENAEGWTLHAEYDKLLARLARLDAQPFSKLTPGQRDYGFHMLRDWFFVRNWYKQGSFETSALVMLLGIVCAHWCAEETGVEDPEKPGDAFAHPLAAWTRMMSHQATLDSFIGGEKHLNLIKAMFKASAEYAAQTTQD